VWWVATAWAGGVLVAGAGSGVAVDGRAAPVVGFEVLEDKGRITVPASSSIDLVWLADGRRERWTGPAAIRITPTGGKGKTTVAVGSVGALALELARLPALVALAPGWRPIDDRQRRKALSLAPAGLADAEDLAWESLYDEARAAGGPADPVPDAWYGVVLLERDPAASAEAFARAAAQCGAAGCPAMDTLHAHALRRKYCVDAAPDDPTCAATPR